MNHFNRWVMGMVAMGFLSGAGTAMADVSLTNRDSKSHEITIKCSSTTHTSIGANVTRGIGKGPCTVTLKSNGASGSGSGSDKLGIKDLAALRAALGAFDHLIRHPTPATPAEAPPLAIAA